MMGARSPRPGEIREDQTSDRRLGASETRIPDSGAVGGCKATDVCSTLAVDDVDTDELGGFENPSFGTGIGHRSLPSGVAAFDDQTIGDQSMIFISVGLGLRFNCFDRVL